MHQIMKEMPLQGYHTPREITQPKEEKYHPYLRGHSPPITASAVRSVGPTLIRSIWDSATKHNLTAKMWNRDPILMSKSPE